MTTSAASGAADYSGTAAAAVAAAAASSTFSVDRVSPNGLALFQANTSTGVNNSQLVGPVADELLHRRRINNQRDSAGEGHNSTTSNRHNNTLPCDVTTVSGQRSDARNDYYRDSNNERSRLYGVDYVDGSFNSAKV